MSNVIKASKSIPANINELAKFVLVGREKLIAVRVEIRAIDKVGLAQEVREQKLREAQDISEAVLDAEVKIGELMAKVPKATPNNNPFHEKDTADVFVKTKTDVIRDAGFTPKQVQRFQTMAAHPEIVEQAKAEARENDDIVSRSSVLNLIKEQKSPHVAFNSGNNEWYTPADYIELAREVMGGIDLDPATSEIAQETVQAKAYYTAEANGLDKPWCGRVWMNPPYSSELIGQFVDKLISELPNIEQAIVLVNNATETEWFNKLVGIFSAVCFPRSRVKYYTPEGKTGAPLQGQALLYFGENVDKFIEIFSSKGWCAIPQ